MSQSVNEWVRDSVSKWPVLQQSEVCFVEQNGSCFADILNAFFSNEHVWFSITVSLDFVHGGLNNNVSALGQIMD